MTDFYSLSAPLRNGKSIDFSSFKGKVVIIVNVASACGKTPQYKVLQELYTKYHDKGLEIIGFPSNQFKAQEPGTDDEIATFCEVNYGVTFPIVKKSDVNGPETNEVFKYVKEKANVQEVTWNFDKAVFGKNGAFVQYFDRTTSVDELEPAISKLL